MNKKYDLSCEQGKSVKLPDNATDEEKESILNELIQDAKDKIPPGTIFEIRQNLNKSGLAWYYKPNFRAPDLA